MFLLKNYDLLLLWTRAQKSDGWPRVKVEQVKSRAKKIIEMRGLVGDKPVNSVVRELKAIDRLRWKGLRWGRGAAGLPDTMAMLP